MVDDPAVRSVRVANALCDRFAELLKGPTAVVSHKSNRALLGVSGDEEALSLRIGEAQQLYPEIWSHLDDARQAFAARGADVSAFDVLRENERRFVGTGVGVQTGYTGVGGPYGFVETFKQAHFNQGGLLRARSAITALQNATPMINWAAIAKAEDNDPHAAAFRRATIIKRIWMFAILFAVLGIPFWYVLWSHHEDRVKREKWRKQYEEQTYQPPPPVPMGTVQKAPNAPTLDLLPADQQAALAASTKKLADNYERAVSAWPDITAPEALAKIRPSKTACPYSIALPAKDVIDRFIKTDQQDVSFVASDFDAFEVKQGVTSDRIALRAQVAKDALRDFTTKQATKYTLDSFKPVEAPYVFVVIDRDDEPAVTSVDPKIRFKGGHVVGHAYMYSPADGTIVCAGAIDAKSSSAADAAPILDGITDEGDANDALHRELEVRIRQALANNLKAVAP